jgi:hypothetical protein
MYGVCSLYSCYYKALHSSFIKTNIYITRFKQHFNKISIVNALKNGRNVVVIIKILVMIKKKLVVIKKKLVIMKSLL